MTSFTNLRLERILLDAKSVSDDIAWLCKHDKADPDRLAALADSARRIADRLDRMARAARPSDGAPTLNELLGG